jgi:hypothetical protein
MDQPFCLANKSSEAIISRAQQQEAATSAAANDWTCRRFMDYHDCSSRCS